MEKKKIAESIIIRVGGGIREVHREQILTREEMDLTRVDNKLELIEEIHSLIPAPLQTLKNGKNNPAN